MHSTALSWTPAPRQAGLATALPFPADPHSDAETILARLIERGLVKPEGAVATHLRAIFRAPPEALRVSRIAKRVYVSRRTLGRQFRTAGLPSPIEWVALARALYAHRLIARGEPLRVAASSGGYPDQFTLSNTIHRITGLRPSELRDVSWTKFLDVWIERQRERGTLTGPPAPAIRSCPLCGTPRAAC